MPYNLLYTRNRTTDAVFDVIDVPISESSVLIEPISFINKFKREFGRVHPIISNQTGTYEEGPSVRLNFAKTRIDFSTYPAPYFLRFYPRYNIKTFAVSVYTGTAAPSLTYKTINGLAYKYKLISGRVDVSFDGGLNSYLSIFPGAIASFILGNPSQRIYAKLANGSAIWVKEGNWNAFTQVTVSQYEAAKIAPFVEL